MRASAIRMTLKSVRTKILDIIRKYHSDISRIASDISFSSLFEQLKKARELISKELKYEKQTELEDRLYEVETYLQASAMYRDILSYIFDSMAEPPETQLDYTIHLAYVYLQALDRGYYSKDAIKEAVRDFSEKGYISIETEKKLQYWAEQGDELAQYILEHYNFSIDRSYQSILNELLNILKTAYIQVEQRYDLQDKHPVDVINMLYQQGDIEALPAIRNWLNKQLFNDYYPVFSVRITDIISANPESVHLIAWYSQGIQYKGRKTNFITLDSFEPDDMRLGEILDEIQEKLEQGYTYTEIVEDMYPDKALGDVLNILVYVKRHK